LRLLELGAGGAPFATAVLEADPSASVVVNDLAGVVGLAQARLDAAALGSRVSLLPGDYFSVDLAPRAFDVVVLGHVCRAEGDEGARKLVARAAGALAPGGVVVLTEYLVDDDRRGPAQALLLGATMLAATSRGTVATAAEALDWLRAAGLDAGPVTRPVPPTAVVLASKPQ
jgi:SAM-dependent methyltransferase